MTPILKLEDFETLALAHASDAFGDEFAHKVSP